MMQDVCVVDTTYHKVMRELAKEGLDGILLSDLANIGFVSGFFTEDSYILISGQGKVFITDSRYNEVIEKKCPGWQVVCVSPQKHLADFVAEFCEKWEIKTLGFEEDKITQGLFSQLNASLTQHLSVIEMKPAGDIVKKLRMIKRPYELDCIRRAARAADDAYLHVLKLMKPGVREYEIAAEIQYQLKKSGMDGESFPSIVAAGAHSSRPHAIPGEYKMQIGDFVTIDMGAKYRGYCSDMTRTVVIGAADIKQKEVYDVVLASQKKAVAAVKPGLRCCDLDAVAREYIAACGYGENFLHSLGHGVGLDIHEMPTISKNCDIVLEPGMVITIEPGVYLPGWGGVRIEDTVIVTEDGCEVITKIPKYLVEL